MFVLKRDGRKEPVHFDKITARITKLSYGLNTDFCDPVLPFSVTFVRNVLSAAIVPSLSLQSKSLQTKVLPCLCCKAARKGPIKDLLTPVLLVLQVMVAQKVAVGVYKGVTTSELDELAAETSASMTATHPDYALVQRLP